MSDKVATATVRQLYHLLDVRGLVAPCYLKPHYGNPRARLAEDLHLEDAHIAALAKLIRKEFGVAIAPITAVTIADIAKMIGEAA
jgi:hypothetical protein